MSILERVHMDTIDIDRLCYWDNTTSYIIQEQNMTRWPGYEPSFIQLLSASFSQPLSNWNFLIKIQYKSFVDIIYRGKTLWKLEIAFPIK